MSSQVRKSGQCHLPDKKTPVLFNSFIFTLSFSWLHFLLVILTFVAKNAILIQFIIYIKHSIKWWVELVFLVASKNISEIHHSWLILHNCITGKKRNGMDKNFCMMYTAVQKNRVHLFFAVLSGSRLVLTFYLSVSNNWFIFLIINKIVTISLTVYNLFTKYNVKIHNYKAQNTRKLDCLIFEVYAIFLHSSVQSFIKIKWDKVNFDSVIIGERLYFWICKKHSTKRYKIRFDLISSSKGSIKITF
jgi:hypothetical protein